MTRQSARDDKHADWKLYAKPSDVLGMDFCPNYLRTGTIDASELSTVASQVKKETGLPIFCNRDGLSDWSPPLRV